MIIKTNPIGAIITILLISIYLFHSFINSSISPSEFLIEWILSIVFVIFYFSLFAHFFVIDDKKVVVQNYVYFWFYKEYRFSEIDKIEVIERFAFGAIVIKINNDKFTISGRKFEKIRDDFFKLKEKGINVISRPLY
jgi:hypothetical protein